MKTIQLTDELAEALFEWCEAERADVLEMSRDVDEDEETRDLFARRYWAIRAVMGQLSKPDVA